MEAPCLNFGYYWPWFVAFALRGGVVSALIFFGVVKQLEAVKILQSFFHLDRAAVFAAEENASAAGKQIMGLQKF